MELTLDLSAFTSAQRYELLALIESFATPQFIPSADESAEHAAPEYDAECAECGMATLVRYHAYDCPMAQN